MHNRCVRLVRRTWVGRMTRVSLNWRSPAGRETVDEFEPEPGQTGREFRRYVREMVGEYHLAGMAVYQSSRPCANWRE